MLFQLPVGSGTGSYRMGTPGMELGRLLPKIVNAKKDTRNKAGTGPDSQTLTRPKEKEKHYKILNRSPW